jgi:putative (di)nucleoside polyphosphate hydrolase
MNPLSQYFRANVGAIIMDMRGRTLVFERKDIPDAWQFPQGGLEEGEEPLNGVLREIKEETGLTENDLEFIDKYPDPLIYELPPEDRSIKTGRGQVQYWYLFKLKGKENQIDLSESDEFISWQWMSVDQILSEVVSFKVKIYKIITEYFSKHLLLN